MDFVNKWIKANRVGKQPLIHRTAQLGDGTRLSIQASTGHYCTPRNVDADHYTSVEAMVYGPRSGRYKRSQLPGYITPWLDNSTDYALLAWVPVEVLSRFIAERGGIVNMDP